MLLGLRLRVLLSDDYPFILVSMLISNGFEFDFAGTGFNIFPIIGHDNGS